LLNQLENPRIYVPVDISRAHLLDAAGALARDYPDIDIAPVCADFTQPFSLPAAASTATRRAVYFPGSTIGNFESAPARRLLESMCKSVGLGGAVLIGIDLKKDPAILERAYDDSARVTAEFNLNALRHLNRELGADFDLSAFEHRAVWNEEKSRIEIYLISDRRQVVRIGREEIRFAEGEYLLTEYSHKYTLESFANLAAEAGLVAQRVWMDPERKFSVQLLEPRSLQ
jgi:L-histidine N-alpha-methyltransferase